MKNIRSLLPALALALSLPSQAQDLTAKIAAVKLVMVAYGYTYVDLRTCSLQEGGQCYFDRSFLGGSDYIIMAVGQDGLSDLDLFAYDANGLKYSEDITTGEYPAVSFRKGLTGTLSIYAKNVDSYSRTYSYSVAILVGYK